MDTLNDSTAVRSQKNKPPRGGFAFSDSSRASWISQRVSIVLASRGLLSLTASCTMFGMNAFSVYLPWVCSGWNALDIVVLGAVVLQTYITASLYIGSLCPGSSSNY
jgi:hypothetical protein